MARPIHFVKPLKLARRPRKRRDSASESPSLRLTPPSAYRGALVVTSAQ